MAHLRQSRPVAQTRQSMPVTRIRQSRPKTLSGVHSSLGCGTVFAPSLEEAQRGEPEGGVFRHVRQPPRQHHPHPLPFLLRNATLNLRILNYTRWYMTLGRCPLSIFCSRGTPLREVQSINRCRTCPEHTFGHAGTNLGSVAGRDPLQTPKAGGTESFYHL